ncbi:MAG: hypothetical protein ACJAXD_001219, partial [Cryomorphaceae bacterium]
RGIHSIGTYPRIANESVVGSVNQSVGIKKVEGGSFLAHGT